MSKRIIHDTDYMQFVMTPPKMTQQEYEMYEPKTSQIRIINNGGGVSGGLGNLSTVMPTQGVFGNGVQDWVMPVVIIVVSAMTLMTLYMVLTKR